MLISYWTVSSVTIIVTLSYVYFRRLRRRGYTGCGTGPQWLLSLGDVWPASDGKVGSDSGVIYDPTMKTLRDEWGTKEVTTPKGEGGREETRVDLFEEVGSSRGYSEWGTPEGKGGGKGRDLLQINKGVVILVRRQYVKRTIQCRLTNDKTEKKV